MKKELTYEQFLESYDWQEVFAEENDEYGKDGASTSNTIDSLDGTCAEPAVTRKDVAEIIALVNGENDGDEWLGVFFLKDGRYLIASGSCDYTGWG